MSATMTDAFTLAPEHPWTWMNSGYEPLLSAP
jgi:hypothetical protein